MLVDSNEEIEDKDLREAFTQAIIPLLIRTPVLRILNKLQRTLDILDIEGLSQLWKQAQPSPPVGVGAPEPTLEEWSTFIDTYLSDATISHVDPKPEDLRHYLLGYLLSATFKDCSIIVRLNLIDPHAESSQDVDPSKVTVIDLDPKSIDRLKKWEKLDTEIASKYAEVEEMNRRTCVDDWAE